uniref:ATP synthase subunit g, mitochondrial n=1 Tax=Ananas comosus var. bracteatus TaxID=296719 RepID=A0A6V7PSZ5_ANACO|nr:unnamed protein product [Ananas comosus var. bracteatus]
MASKLNQLRAKAAQASQLVTKHGCAYYKELLESNKKYIVDPPTVETCQELSKKLFYTRLANYENFLVLQLGGLLSPLQFIPGRYEAFWKELDGVKHIWKNRKDLKVEDAGIAALFGLELYAWFCVGEIVGRGFTFTGYYV